MSALCTTGKRFAYEAGTELADASDGNIETAIYTITTLWNASSGWGWIISRHGTVVRTAQQYESEQDAEMDAREECEAIFREAYADHGDPRIEPEYYD